MDVGHVKFIRPRAPLLAPYIKGYYVHSSADPNFHTELTFYQNITTTISIYRDSVTTSEGRRRYQTYQADKGFSAVLVGLVDKYQEVEFRGPLDRLAIVFYPLGINHFMRSPLSHHLKKHYSIFDYFSEPFQDLLPKVYAESSLETKSDLLDAFFVERFESLAEPKLLSAVEQLLQAENLPKVDELAQGLQISRRSLLRKFKKHLGYSVEEYIAVIRFRRALANFQRQQDKPFLTDIAYDSDYYDQADFNHHLKSRSGLTPKQLFAQLQIVDDTLFWKL